MGCISGKRLCFVDGIVISVFGGGSVEWWLYMGYDFYICQFIDFELIDSRDVEWLDWFV